ncbi:MAG: hypothetical protein JNL10_14490 [Verrucomicrobiales bacterium]|nr:hypothetical protein [Verrucomicrobiales bacterium]
MKKLLVVSLMALTAALSSGCYSTETGRTKFGMPFAKDSIVSRYNRPVSVVFAAAKEVLAFNGTLTSENLIDNTVTAKADSKTIYVKVTEVEAGVAQIATQVRGSAGGPDIDLASEIDKQIAIKLAQSK